MPFKVVYKYGRYGHETLDWEEYFAQICLVTSILLGAVDSYLVRTISRFYFPKFYVFVSSSGFHGYALFWAYSIFVAAILCVPVWLLFFFIPKDFWYLKLAVVELVVFVSLGFGPLRIMFRDQDIQSRQESSQHQMAVDSSSNKNVAKSQSSASSRGSSNRSLPQADSSKKVTAYADFFNASIQEENMQITPGYGFAYNTAFPRSRTWRITAFGGGFTGMFTVPAGGQYDLVVEHGSSYDDRHRQDGYSPVTIQTNSQTVAQDYSPRPGADVVEDSWPVSAHAGQNTLRWTLGDGATTHYWIRSIRVVKAD